MHFINELIIIMSAEEGAGARLKMKLIVLLPGFFASWFIKETSTLKMDGALHYLDTNVSYFFHGDKYLAFKHQNGSSTFSEEGVLQRLFPSVPNDIEAAKKVKDEKTYVAFIKDRHRYRFKSFELQRKYSFPDATDESYSKVHIKPDAIAFDSESNTKFIFENGTCWIIDVSGSKKLLNGSPKHCSKSLHGAPSNIEAALIIDRNLYALKDGSVWKWNVISMPSNLTVGYPKRFNEVFAGVDGGPSIISKASFSFKQFVGFTIKEIQTSSLLSCFKECQKMPYLFCSSLNFEAFDVSGSNHRCQINRFKERHFPEKMIDNINYVYYEVNW